MEENGFELKEMNLKLLQKVEELTLHLIRQNKELKIKKIGLQNLRENWRVTNDHNTKQA